MTLEQINQRLKEIRNTLSPMVHANQTDTSECRRLFDEYENLVKIKKQLARNALG